MRLLATRVRIRVLCQEQFSSSLDEVYKAAKVSANGDVKTNGRATVENEKNDEGVEAGPAMPSGEDEEGPEDEEGRFFGGGITRNTKEVLDFMDEQDQNDVVRSASVPFQVPLRC